MRFLLNPFFIYVYSFSATILLFLLHWSNLFPDLSIGLISFFIITFVISLFFGMHLSHCRKKVFSTMEGTASKDIWKAKLVIAGYFLEFSYVGNIPLISIFTSSDSFSHFGGIPTFHVLLVTYNVFLSSVLFHRIICFFDKKNTFYFIIITLLPPLLMVNRGMFFTIFFSCLFVFLFSLKKVDMRKILYCIIGLIFALYLFAILGSARIKDDDSKIFAAYTQPSENFESLDISDMFLWPYMYAASPIGNLQICINDFVPNYSFSSFFFECICPDFISKKMHISNEKRNPPLISPTFNVSTMYYEAFVHLGYLGMFLLYFVQTIFVYVIFLFSKPANNQYYTVTISLMCAVIILNTFANMWVFSAVSFPIIWGPVSFLFKRLKW